MTTVASNRAHSVWGYEYDPQSVGKGTSCSAMGNEIETSGKKGLPIIGTKPG